MKVIRISTDLELSVHNFPEGSYKEQNRFLRDLIGNGCDMYEHVMPKRLYTELNMAGQITKIPGQCVSMLVDEEGKFKDNAPNLVGSYLYMTDRHGDLIVGNILFVGEKWSEDGIDFCGIEDNTFKRLELELTKLIKEVANK